MNREIKIKDTEIKYQIRKSSRARRLRVTVYCDASVVVTMPNNMGETMVEKFLNEKASWLVNKIDFFKKIKKPLIAKNSKKDYLENKEKARALASERVKHFNKIYNFKYKKVNIRNQKTRWGSCSRKGNLNFNYKIIYLPKLLSDYIIVHELCHLGELNHSSRFWNLVSMVFPDYLNMRKELRKQEFGYL